MGADDDEDEAKGKAKETEEGGGGGGGDDDDDDDDGDDGELDEGEKMAKAMVDSRAAAASAGSVHTWRAAEVGPGAPPPLSSHGTVPSPLFFKSCLMKRHTRLTPLPCPLRFLPPPPPCCRCAGPLCMPPHNVRAAPCTLRAALVGSRAGAGAGAAAWPLGAQVLGEALEAAGDYRRALMVMKEASEGMDRATNWWHPDAVRLFGKFQKVHARRPPRAPPPSPAATACCC